MNIHKQQGELAVEYGLIIAILITILIVSANAMAPEIEIFFESSMEKITEWLS